MLRKMGNPETLPAGRNCGQSVERESLSPLIDSRTSGARRVLSQKTCDVAAGSWNSKECICGWNDEPLCDPMGPDHS